MSETLEIDIDLSIVDVQLIVHNLSVIVLRYQEKRMINRRLYHYFVAWLSKAVQSKSNASYNAWHKADVL